MRPVNFMRQTLAATALAGALLLPHALLADDAKSFDMGMIPPGHVMLPDGEPAANVFLISGPAGWGDAEQTEAQALVDKGAAVVGIDFPAYMKTLAADDGDCVYMISDVESLAHQVQRAGGATSYAPPIVAGVGEGGALALAMIAQSPAATIGQAIAVDPLAGIPLKKILCTPAEKKVVGDRTVYGLTDGELPAPVTVLFTDKADPAGKAHVAELVTRHAEIDSRSTDQTASDALAKILSDQVDAAGNADDPLGLPISVLDAKPVMDTMAIVFSGDGGWRDIDKQVGGVLQQQGIPVVGLDSLKYFWSERKPQETADDLARIIDAYRKQWDVQHVLLVGYSFGADVMPATYNLLSEQDKARVPQITLMALSHEVDYEVSVDGWLGVSSSDGKPDPVNDIAKLDPRLIQCVYGKDEDEDACPTLKDKGVEIVALEGGHHFDGDYQALGLRIINSLKERLAKQKT